MTESVEHTNYIKKLCTGSNLICLGMINKEIIWTCIYLLLNKT